ncbi:MAG: hypothetical protein CMO80_04755 [Verrucomicrobiales bacterium]|nr:hypothetical protein [Verrucomicrobiales bacterium]|tara:strand:+ start:3475 stop:4641 length:1167 start_codon:yes stop_codon:yes gene_type:complete
MQLVRISILLLALTLPAFAQENITLTETNGTKHVGKIFSPKSDGVILRKPSGGLSGRIKYNKLDQASLKLLEKNKKAKPYVEFLINRPKPKGGQDASLPAPKRGKLDPPSYTDVEGKPELPEVGSFMGAMFGSLPGWFMILVIYGANIFAGYAVGIYRRWNKFMVPGISAAAPIIAPIVFICMKPRKVEKKDTVLGKKDDDDGKPAKKKAAAVAAKPKAKKVVAAQPAGAAAKKVAQAKRPAAPAAPAKIAAPAAPGAGGGGGGGIAAPAPIAAPAAPKPPGAQAPAAPAAESGALEAASYTKGEVNINKRFIETKFAPFFKLVPDEPYRSAWLCFITTRGEYWVKRIPKITQTDVTLQCPQEGGGTMDQVAQITDIQEIHVRPGDEG